MPIRDKTIMMKRATPKKVTLPNGRTFISRYKRVTRDQLPANIRLRRPYMQRTVPHGRRCVQRGRAIDSNILKLVKKIVKVPII